MKKIVNPETKYYIISTKHTGPNDEFITLWRPDNAGYCYAKEHAGIYEGYKSGYHDVSDIPVKVEVLGPLFEYLPGYRIHRLRNDNSVWSQLGYKLVKGELIKH